MQVPLLIEEYYRYFGENALEMEQGEEINEDDRFII